MPRARSRHIFGKTISSRLPIAMGIADPELEPETISIAEAIWEQQIGSTLYLTLGAFSMETLTSIDTSLRDKEIDWVYIAPLRAVRVESILTETHAAGVATWSGVPDYVEEGVAFGATQRGSRPAILVNLGAARSEGIEFAADLLTLAVIVSDKG